MTSRAHATVAREDYDRLRSAYDGMRDRAREAIAEVERQGRRGSPEHLRLRHVLLGETKKPPLLHDRERVREQQAKAHNALREAIPDDPRGWWIGDEIDLFIDQWRLLNLPELTMEDGSGSVLTLWCTDVRRAAEMVGMSDNVGNDEGFTISKGDYEVCIVQASKN